MNYPQHKIYTELTIWLLALGLALLLQPPQTTFAYVSFGYFMALGLWGLKQQQRQRTSVLHKFYGIAVYLLLAPLLAPFVIGANLGVYMTLSICTVLATFVCTVVAVIYAENIDRYNKAYPPEYSPHMDSILHD